MRIQKTFSKDVVRILRSGGVGVIPTDTIYGIVGSALSEKAVARIYRLKKRNPKKKMIILIGSLSELIFFKTDFSLKSRRVLEKIWPGPVSVEMSMRAKNLFYLHRGTKKLSFRLPSGGFLRNFLRETGPLVAPSANTEGKPPATTIGEAKKYFGNGVDFYVDHGRIRGKPSTLISIDRGTIKVLRK